MEVIENISYIVPRVTIYVSILLFPVIFYTNNAVFKLENDTKRLAMRKQDNNTYKLFISFNIIIYYLICFIPQNTTYLYLFFQFLIKLKPI